MFLNLSMLSTRRMVISRRLWRSYLYCSTRRLLQYQTLFFGLTLRLYFQKQNHQISRWSWKLVVNSLHCRASTPRQRTAASSSDGVYEVARLPPFPSIPSAHGSRALLLLFWQLAVASPFWMPAWYVALPPLRHQIGNQRLSRTADWGHFHRGLGGKAGLRDVPLHCHYDDAGSSCTALCRTSSF